MRPPSTAGAASESSSGSGTAAAASARTRPPGASGLNWAKKGGEGGGAAGGGKRLFVYILGGAVRWVGREPVKTPYLPESASLLPPSPLPPFRVPHPPPL